MPGSSFIGVLFPSSIRPTSPTAPPAAMVRAVSLSVPFPLIQKNKFPSHPRPVLSLPRPPRLYCHSDAAAVTATPAAAEVGTARVVNPSVAVYRMAMPDQAFFLLAFIAATASMAFTALVIAAVPTLFAMKRAAISLARLADTAREELPSTMAAVRLSGMEISDLTLELSDLSHEIADGVSKSGQAVQAAEAGIRQIGSIAHSQTISMVQERANLPDISVKPVVFGAAKKASRVVGQATKHIMNLISQSKPSSEDEEYTLTERETE